MCFAWLALVALSLAANPDLAKARSISSKLEVRQFNLTASFQTFTYDNSYINPVVVCTEVLQSKNVPSMTTRIANVTATSFQAKIIATNLAGTATPSKAFCIIAEKGAHTVGGVKFEALTVTANGLNGQYVANDWNVSQMVEITNMLSHTYTTPTIVGQVMSNNDPDFSVFWTTNCLARNQFPFTGTGKRVCVGRHIGMVTDTRLPETLGVIVAESATFTYNNVVMKIANGATTVGGVGNNPPYSYTVTEDYDYAVGQQLSERGGNGGWTVLYGVDPLPNTRIQWATEEETIERDMTRGHVNEAVSYWAFKDLGLPDITIGKSSAVAVDSAQDFSIPSSDLIYTVNVNNIGAGPAHDLFVVDKLPLDPSTGAPAVSLFTGDMDGTGPATGPILFADAGTGVTLPSANTGFSTSSTKPTSMAQCTSFSGAQYNPNIRFICVQPDGEMTPGSFSLKYRAQIK